MFDIILLMKQTQDILGTISKGDIAQENAHGTDVSKRFGAGVPFDQDKHDYVTSPADIFGLGDEGWPVIDEPSLHGAGQTASGFDITTAPEHEHSDNLPGNSGVGALDVPEPRTALGRFIEKRRDQKFMPTAGTRVHQKQVLEPSYRRPAVITGLLNNQKKHTQVGRSMGQVSNHRESNWE